MRLLGLLALCCGAIFAQDLRRVQSPNGDFEFRLFLAPQDDRTFFRVAYQVDYRGKPLLDTSYLGFDIWDQEPLLGENTGLIASNTASTPDYNGLTARYMQNGSLGRLLQLEVRASDTGVAFRYVIPHSTILRELLIADEATEFVTAAGAPPVDITEVSAPNYPPMHLEREREGVQVTRLRRLPSNKALAFEGKPPLTTSWRVIRMKPGKESADAHRPPGEPPLR